MAKDKISFDELVDDGIQQVNYALNKGQDLRGAIRNIICGARIWHESQKLENTNDNE